MRIGSATQENTAIKLEKMEEEGKGHGEVEREEKENYKGRGVV